METIQVGDTEVRYEVCGEGEPVICLHANPFVDWYLPLFERMPDYAFLRYSRRPLDDAPLSIAGDAATCRQLADHVGWERAHIIGHSAGALTALQLAVDAPDLVHSLCLLEPAVPSPSSDGDDTGDEDPFAPILQASRGRRLRDRHGAIPGAGVWQRSSSHPRAFRAGRVRAGGASV